MSKPLRDVQSFIHNPHSRKQKWDILWPCWIYTVAMPVVDERLNMFERAVLRLTNLGVCGASAISRALCFPDEKLARFILTRLEAKKLVNGENITSEGRQFLEQRSEGVYKNVLVYFELVKGQILPYFTCAAPTFLLPREEGGYWLGSVGGVNILRNPTIIPESREQLRPPAESEIFDALKTYEKICATQTNLENHEPDNIDFMHGSLTIKVQNNPKKIYLHCLCFLSANSRDVLVCNPFGFDQTLPQLTDAFASCSRYDEVKSNLLGSAGKKSQFGSNEAMPLWFEEYPEISSDLVQLVRRGGMRENAVRVACSALEHILRRIFLEYRDRTVAITDLLCNSDIIQTRENLINAARSLEQVLDENAEKFLTIPPDEIHNAVKGKNGLRSLLALNLMQTLQCPHPLAQILRNNPDGLIRLQCLLTMRNEASHGGEKTYLINQDNIDWVRKFIQDLLEAWKPGKKIDLNNKETDAEIDAREIEIALQKYFPKILRDKMGATLEMQLQRAEGQFQHDCVEEMAVLGKEAYGGSAVELAGFCQAVLAQISAINSSYVDIQYTDDMTYVARAEKIAVNAGFSLPDGKLPQGLITVSPEYVINAMGNQNTTLGGQCLAWILHSDVEKLKCVAEKIPDMLINLDRLIQLRGHGDTNISAAAMAANRENIYNDFRLLLEEN